MTDRSTWLLAVAAATAVVTVSTAAIVWNNRVVEARARDTGSHMDWTLEASTAYGRNFALFLDPTIDHGFGSGGAGFIVAGSTAVTMLGLNNHKTGSLDGAELFAIDTGDGSVRWRTPVQDLAGCASETADGKLFCYTINYEDDPSLLSVDVDTGVMHRTPTDWSIFAIAVDDDKVYVVEGRPEDNDLRLHRGSADDAGADWTTTLDMGDAYESIHGARLLRVGHGAGVVELGGEVVGFDLETGEQTWDRRLPECSEVVGPSLGGVVTRIKVDCGTNAVVGSELIGPDGQVLARSKSAAAQRLQLDAPGNEEVPVLLGDSAYDRASGEKLWTSPALVSHTLGTAVAVVGDVAVLRDLTTQRESGLDLRNGDVLWERELRAANPLVAIDDSVVVTDTGDAIVAWDVRTGTQNWELRVDSIGPQGRSFAEPATLGRVGKHVVYVTEATIAGLS